MDAGRIKLAYICAALILCSACDPVYMIRRDFSMTAPVDGDCADAVIENLRSIEPIRNVNVIPTPSAGVEEVLVSNRYARVSWILSEDRTDLRLSYGSTRRVSRTEIESARSLILDVEDRIRRNCPGAGNMVLISEACTKIDCQKP